MHDSDRLSFHDIPYELRAGSKETGLNEAVLEIGAVLELVQEYLAVCFLSAFRAITLPSTIVFARGIMSLNVIDWPWMRAGPTEKSAASTSCPVSARRNSWIMRSTKRWNVKLSKRSPSWWPHRRLTRALRFVLASTLKEIARIRFGYLQLRVRRRKSAPCEHLRLAGSRSGSER
ncbi:hypothetical protein X734_05895 [Mesorhizobium sp. L2C084A000]|nr:hypothetical protein X734_05895 [Mesorhizobium sp. L2C084A000]